MTLVYLSPALLILLGAYLLAIAAPEFDVDPALTTFMPGADEAMLCFLTAAVLIAVNLAITYPCRYTLTADSLNIRCGLITKSIGLEQIRGAELSTSWRSGPALSLKRVRIRHTKGETLISPVEREPFVLDLNEAIAHRKEAGEGVHP